MNALRSLLCAVLTVCSGLVAAAEPAQITPDALAQRVEQKDAKLVVLDVRTPEEFAAGHVPGARNIPHTQLANRIAEITQDKNKEVVVYCRSGKRAALAMDTLSQNGFTRLMHLEGDMLKWEEQKRPVEKQKAQ